jgi:nucleotide-binding universal stress UspA family protein
MNLEGMKESAITTPQAPATIISPIRSLLVAADLSRASRNAVRYGIDIARQSGAKLQLVHVVSPLRYSFGGVEVIQEATQTATRGIDDFEIRLACIGKLKGVSSRFWVREGDVASEIEALADKEHVDLIVVGTNCPTGISYLVRGSVGERIFRSMTLPVLTVNVNTSRPGLNKNIRHILVTTDFGSASVAALSHAVSLATQFGASLTVLYVYDSKPQRQLRCEASLVECSLQRLREMPLSGNVDSLDIRFVVQTGDVVDAILHTARAQSASIIVMGLTRARLLARLAHAQSIAYRVVCGAQCPVLSVRT